MTMEQQMSRQQAVDPKAAEALSALMDGEVQDAALIAQACRAWRDDTQLRESWHRYHLIGDVLRSDDLASAAGRDADFLARLRVRLEAEPVVLAPSPRPAATRVRRWRWAAPAAVAAGFVAVAGVLVVTRVPEPVPAQAAAALADAAVRPVSDAAVKPSPAAPLPAEPEEIVASGKMIRDARIDRYLEAHHQFGNSTVLGGSPLVRRAAVDAVQR